MMAQTFILTVAFLLFEAKSLVDYAIGFFSLIGAIDCIILYSISIWQLVNTLKFIGTVEEFIEKSKSSLASK